MRRPSVEVTERPRAWTAARSGLVGAWRGRTVPAQILPCGGGRAAVPAALSGTRSRSDRRERGGSGLVPLPTTLSGASLFETWSTPASSFGSTSGRSFSQFLRVGSEGGDDKMCEAYVERKG
ncbi:hypothetical protein Celaphus_00017502 [Cervus elaphus hippelaphus]|uniref:Uncharacterized protein n=1 Tax=Cervus elaphus hippelaphus TaxID=46360 RepID=A0A212D617_CEREH|nr:hypothetical protein Celaphus_00017502 [Cervus elaphus hippelaphus]